MNNLVASTQRESRIVEIVGPAITQMGFELVRVRIGGGRQMCLQIMAERINGGMEINDCAKISKTISTILDEEDPISDDYTLEVSSPGIDRPLTRLVDFENWLGHVAKVELIEPHNGQRRFKGIISDIQGNLITIQSEHYETDLEFKSISNAKLVITDALMKAASGAENSPDNDLKETQ